MFTKIITVPMAYAIVAIHGSGFGYPTNMPPPMDAQTALLSLPTPFLREFESPIQTRLVASITALYYDCITVYKENGFDVFTKKEPIVRADTNTITNYGNDETKVLCAFYANLIVLNKVLPDSSDTVIQLFDDYGLNSSLTDMDPSVSSCDTADAQCLENAAIAQNYEPQIMASIVAKIMLDFLENDGWNADGSINKNNGQCTANCRPYSDTTGYEPEIGDLDRWQRLSESDGKGFFYQYDHVVPHIGFTARTYYTPRATLRERSSPNPNYDYEEESELVIERLRNLATNDTQKMLVEFFDDKLSVGGAVFATVGIVLGWTYEERTFYAAGFTMAEYEAVIHAWREKRIWDMVRPTTLIKNGIAGDTITTYGGPYQGVQTINAQDFESYFRVMPHSEYPSGSGCICLAIAQFTDTYLADRHGMADSLSVGVPAAGLAPFVAGSSSIEPGVTPAQDIFVTLSSLTELSDMCGESRLWGGMHFTASIDGATQLCDGVGSDAYDYMVNIEAGNSNEFIEFESEVIEPFDDEYELELGLTLGKKKKKYKKRKSGGRYPFYGAP